MSDNKSDTLSTNHDFTLKIFQNIGDPRWFPVE